MYHSRGGPTNVIDGYPNHLQGAHHSPNNASPRSMSPLPKFIITASATTALRNGDQKNGNFRNSRKLSGALRPQDSFSTDTGCESGSENLDDSGGGSGGGGSRGYLDYSDFPPKIVSIGYDSRAGNSNSTRHHSDRGDYEYGSEHQNAVLLQPTYEEHRARSRSTPTSPRHQISRNLAISIPNSDLQHLEQEFDEYYPEDYASSGASLGRRPSHQRNGSYQCISSTGNSYQYPAESSDPYPPPPVAYSDQYPQGASRHRSNSRQSLSVGERSSPPLPPTSYSPRSSISSGDQPQVYPSQHRGSSGTSSPQPRSHPKVYSSVSTDPPRKLSRQSPYLSQEGPSPPGSPRRCSFSSSNRRSPQEPPHSPPVTITPDSGRRRLPQIPKASPILIPAAATIQAGQQQLPLGNQRQRPLTPSPEQYSRTSSFAFFSQSTEEQRRHSAFCPQPSLTTANGTKRQLPQVPKVHLQKAASDYSPTNLTTESRPQDRRHSEQPPNRLQQRPQGSPKLSTSIPPSSHQKLSNGSLSARDADMFSAVISHHPRQPTPTPTPSKYGGSCKEVSTAKHPGSPPTYAVCNGIDASRRQSEAPPRHHARQPSYPAPPQGRNPPPPPPYDPSGRQEERQDFSKSIRRTSNDRQCWSPPHSQTPSPPLWRQNGAPGYQPSLHTNNVCSPTSRKYCQRRPSLQGVQEYVDTPCTCKGARHVHRGSDTPSAECYGSTSDFEDSQMSSGVHSPSSQDALERSPEHLESHSRNGSPHGSNEGRNGNLPYSKDAPPLSPSPKRYNSLKKSATSKSYSENVGRLASITSLENQRRKSSLFTGGLGSLHFTVQYFPIRRRLRVSIARATGLAGQLRPDLELNTFIKVCLTPGKLQKQQSRIVKRTRDANFNEEFFFDNVTPKEIENKQIYLRVCHHLGKQFAKDPVIGELEVPLKEINGLLTKKEVALCEDLRPRISTKKLGRIQLGLCIEKEAKRLTVNVFKAQDLPKIGIAGPPDPMVRITVDQNGKVQTKQSRTLKGTTRAVYNEAVMFLVSTKLTDLEHTSVVVSIIDTKRTATGDDVIGQVFLGTDAKDKSELEQWANALKYLGKEIKVTHTLKRDDGFVEGTEE